MGIFSFKRRVLLEADDEDEDDDYTAGADSAGDDESNDDAGGDDNSGGDDDDYTAGVDGAAEDDSSDSEGGDVDLTGDDSGGDDDDYGAGADSAGDDESEDTGEGSDGGGEDSDSDSDSSDDDYTSGADSAGEDSGADGDIAEDGSDGGGEDESGEGEEGEETDAANYEDLKKIESELFSNLTPEQVNIKNEELKQRFIDIYSTIASVLLRINDIPKTDTNISSLEFVTDKLIELRDMVDYNITKAFNTRTYIENSIVYQLCLSTLNSISQIIDSTSQAEAPDEEEEQEDMSGVVFDDTSDADDPAAGADMIAVGDRMTENAKYSHVRDVKLI